MENNLVELKFDNVNRFFDELKIKYGNEYQNNKTITKEVYVYPIIRILKILFIYSLLTFTCLGGFWYIKNYTNYTTDLEIVELLKFLTDILTQSLLMFLLFSSFFFISYMITNWIDFIPKVRKPAHIKQKRKTLSRKKYFSEIRDAMIYYVRWNLSYSIKENMLIFDKNGLIIGPDLSKKENKRVFSEAERKLEIKDEQYSRRNQLS